jgi:hypothetical protein
MAEKFLKLAVLAASYVLCAHSGCSAAEEPGLALANWQVPQEVVDPQQQNPPHELELRIPKEAENIEKEAYAGREDIESVAFDEGSQLKKIETRAFAGCTSLNGVVVPPSVESIGEAAFFGCEKLASVTCAGKNITEIGEEAFGECTSLNNFVIPPSVQIIGEGAFWRTKLKEVIIPPSVKVISKAAFLLCDLLEDVIISEGVETIGQETFKKCIALKNIVIPKSVTSFGKDVFRGSGIENIRFESDVDDEKKIALLNSMGNVPLHCVAQFGDGTVFVRGEEWFKIKIVWLSNEQLLAGASAAAKSTAAAR